MRTQFQLESQEQGDYRKEEDRQVMVIFAIGVKGMVVDLEGILLARIGL